MNKSAGARDAPAAARLVLLLLQAAMLVRPTQQATTPQAACPISSPVIDVSPGDLDIPVATDCVLRLTPGTYKLNNTFFLAANQSLCLIGPGTSRDDVVISFAQPGFTGNNDSRHFALAPNSWLHLQGLTLTGGANGTLPGGVLVDTPDVDTRPTFTANNVRFTRIKTKRVAAWQCITCSVAATFQDTEFSNNNNGGVDIAALLYLGNPPLLSVDLLFSGNTLFSGNQGGWAAVSLVGVPVDENSEPPRIRAVFDGTIQFLNNIGALYVEWGADISFSGPLLEMSGNTASSSTAALVDLVNINDATLNDKPNPIKMLFGSDKTLFANNRAAANTPSLGLAIRAETIRAPWPGVAAPVVQHSIVLTFAKPAVFRNNTIPAAAGSAALGAALMLLAQGGPTITVDVQDCLLFENNKARNGSSRAAAIQAGLPTLTPNGSTVHIVASGPNGKLVFGSNTIGSVEADVALGIGTSITCNASGVTRGPGVYAVECNICSAAAAGVVSGGIIACAPGDTATCAGSQPPPADATCPAPPTGGSSAITGYSGCSVSPSDNGGFTIGAACTATCTTGTSSGFAACRLGPSGPLWQVQPCQPVCSGVPAIAPPLGSAWQCGAATTPAGGSCSAPCLASQGLSGGPVSVICQGPDWSSTTLGSCSRAACIGPPPASDNPPHAVFSTCTSTPVGGSCRATCAPSFSGFLKRVCRASGLWGPVLGDADCVDCAANQPTLEAATSQATNVAQGSPDVSVAFAFTAPYVVRSTYSATLDGVAGSCTVQPALLSGAATTATPITATCQLGPSISPGPHTIALAAAFAGSNGCSSGSLSMLSSISVTVAPTPAPLVVLDAAAGGAPPVCKAAPGGETVVAAVFSYTVATGSSSTRGLLLTASASAGGGAGATCTTNTPTGSIGAITASCRGIFDGTATSLSITASLTASTAGSLAATATGSQTVDFVCCTSLSSSTGPALAVNTAGSCMTCSGLRSPVEGVWQQGALASGVMRSGALSDSCTSDGADVGQIEAACDESNPNVLRFIVTNPAGSSAAFKFITRCDSPPSPGYDCLASGPYQWRTVSSLMNSLTESKTATQVVYKFGILQASCTCGEVYWALQQSGSFSLGSVGPSGACPAAAAGRSNILTKKKTKPKNGGRWRRP